MTVSRCPSATFLISLTRPVMRSLPGPRLLMVRAEKEAKRLKDEYVSVEHLFLALLNEGTGTPAGLGESAPAGELFKMFGFTVDNVVQTVEEVCS